MDEWGNARWVIYNVSVDPVVSVSSPKPMNSRRMVDCDPDLWSYYYRFGRDYYAPCFRVGGKVYRGFAIVVPAGGSVSSEHFFVVGSGSAWGYFVYHYEWLFGLGKIFVSGCEILFFRDFVLPLFFWDGLFVSLLFFYLDKRLLLSGAGGRVREYIITSYDLLASLFSAYVLTGLVFVGFLPFIAAFLVFLYGASLVLLPSWVVVFRKRVAAPSVVMLPIFVVLRFAFYFWVLGDFCFPVLMIGVAYGILCVYRRIRRCRKENFGATFQAH